MKCPTMAAALALAVAACAPDGGQHEATAEAESLIYRSGTYTDLSWWTHDDGDGGDVAYLSFASPSYEYSEDAGVFVDVPDCASGDTFRVTYAGMAAGTWQYRAALRLTIAQSGQRQDIHGAQVYLSQPASPSAIVPVNIAGVFTAPVEDGGACRVALKGKVFTGEMYLFGGATLAVERHR